MENKQSPPYNGKTISKSEKEIENNRIIKAEQHRNTRHDAIDKINEIREEWSKTHDFSMTDKMFDEIIGAIMNLKQRP